MEISSKVITECVQFKRKIEAPNANLSERVSKRTSALEAAKSELKGVEAMLSLKKGSQTELRMSLVDLSGTAVSVLDELQQQDRSRKLTSAHLLAHDLQQPVCASKAFSAALDGELAKRGADKERPYSGRIRAASQQMLDFRVQPGVRALGRARLLQMPPANLLGNA